MKNKSFVIQTNLYISLTSVKEMQDFLYGRKLKYSMWEFKNTPKNKLAKGNVLNKLIKLIN